MTMVNGTAAMKDTLSVDEQRLILLLAWSERSRSWEELSSQLETPRDDLRDAIDSLLQRRFLVVSRGIGSLDDTYVLTKAARAYARRNLLPDAPRSLPIEELTPADKRR